MADNKKQISSGIDGLNRVLNGLYIGDNVVWYDTAGSLASEFCLKFIRESRDQNRAIVYVSFDRSPKNLIEKLGILAENQQLTILDCFTNGKGDKAEVFNKFYEKDGAQWPYQVIKVTRPHVPQAVLDAVLGLHKSLRADVRFVFESLTGMADLWGGEDHILKFYSHTCPQLYELDTIAYWIIEKEAHSNRLKAHINQVAQVAIDLSMEQGRTRLNVLKAENRSPKALGKPIYYTTSGDDITFQGKKEPQTLHDLGGTIKNFRKKQGMSQKELSRLVGVTPSNISQIESNQVFPSIPALYKIAGHLSVDVGSFFQEKTSLGRTIFRQGDGIKINPSHLTGKSVAITQLTPFDLDGRVDLFSVEILPDRKLASHFFQHKGDEIGFVLDGEINMVYQDKNHSLKPGDVIYLKTDSPTQWQNKTSDTVKFLWMKVK